MSTTQAQDLRQIYHHIIDDVVAKMKPGFLQESVDESVLQVLRQRWSQKLTEKGIISEPEPQVKPEPVAIKKDEDGQGSRKRPYDGSAPNNRQEAAAAAAAGSMPMPAAAGYNAPLKGPAPHMQLQRPAQAVAAAAAGSHPGVRPCHPQVPMGRAPSPVGIAAGQPQQNALSALQQQSQLQGQLLQNALANVQGLPPQQQHAALQAHLQAQLQRQAAMAQLNNSQQGLLANMQGQGQMAGMQLGQGRQLQGVPAGLRPPGLQQQTMAHQQVQQQVLQQLLRQQQVQQQAQQQQQQGLRMPALPAGLPGGMQQANLATLLQQQQQGLLQQQQRIPQNDGSADMPPSLAEVAAAAGLQPDRLRAMLPRRIAAIMDRAAAGSSSSSSSRDLPAAAAAAAAGTPIAAAGGAPGVRSSNARSTGSNARRAGAAGPGNRRFGGVIPQVDGNGDEEEDEEDYVGDGYEDGGDDGGAADEGDEGDEEEVEDESEDESDDPELAKFSAEMDALEEADKEETGDVGFALYEKVHRAKSRWRCNLRYGVFLINGKEYMFNKGSTDFMF